MNDNCAGCKWLDSRKRDANGYCCMVENSEQGKQFRATKNATASIKVRRSDMKRCELYEPGKFETRYAKEQKER